jgi:hypothetical protein
MVYPARGHTLRPLLIKKLAVLSVLNKTRRQRGKSADQHESKRTDYEIIVQKSVQHLKRVARMLNTV